eukprot:CAMPEP_0172552716 /NCGR_PEP_ID=MMETSP1067-20121228/47088_1 /TAXON_ID=265564 ORGANISM="Thalassiosira punctigera, Strain Tpunct2005C2" /NCGR_SAMPLE_ID=MMETSP1067 /ASSEMBLY_ACC=CAM_ASM_000444 /LENGTH=159 /DNA_ID=CAMNT_0013340763 /DNA_START=86 /DNA_END=564 /DNA_ORIENTATION=-
MGLFSNNRRDKDFDVEANAPPLEPPLVTATPIADYSAAASSLPTPAEAVSTHKINTSQQQQQFPAFGRHPTNIPVCPHCSRTNVATRTSTFPSLETWLMAAGPAAAILAGVLDAAGDGQHETDRAFLHAVSQRRGDGEADERLLRKRTILMGVRGKAGA